MQRDVYFGNYGPISSEIDDKARYASGFDYLEIDKLLTGKQSSQLDPARMFTLLSKYGHFLAPKTSLMSNSRLQASDPMGDVNVTLYAIYHKVYTVQL